MRKEGGGGTMQWQQYGKNGGDGGSHFGAVLEWFWVQYFFWANMIEFWWILGVVLGVLDSGKWCSEELQ